MLETLSLAGIDFNRARCERSDNAVYTALRCFFYGNNLGRRSPSCFRFDSWLAGEVAWLAPVCGRMPVVY